MIDDRSGTAADDVDLAVIGMSCRLPGADDLAAFWDNLRDGVESVSFFGPDDLDSPLSDHPDYVPACTALTAIDEFDSSLFGYPAHEAALIDPQHRIFLEAAWTALEDAGYAPTGGPRPIGVYAGAGLNTYLINNVLRRDAGERDDMRLESAADLQVLLGGASASLPTRVSYRLDLTGPSVNVQSACSTGLVAVHLACQALLAGECDMALAGAVNVRVPNRVGHLYQDGMIFSPDGHCRTFDKDADGTVFGDGVGVVVLKLLDRALADGDEIDAIIKGSAVNNDGAMKIGFAAPSVSGQADVISQALEVAGVEPASISYVEAHGTGTRLGDPVEIAALARAYARGPSARTAPCAIGSVKTNIGHLAEAAGIAGLIKTVLALRHRQLPPSLHFVEPNPEIDFARTRFSVNTTLADWPSNGAPRRAGVSAFGMGGTNAHVVLEEAPSRPPPATMPDRTCHVLALSARSEHGLQEVVRRYVGRLEREPPVELADLCFTANTGRHHFDHRLAVVAGSIEGLRKQLAAVEDGAAPSGRPGVVAGVASPADDGDPQQRSPGVVFVFDGTDDHRGSIGRQLMAAEPVFRQAIDRCRAALDDLGDGRRPVVDVWAVLDGTAPPATNGADATPASVAFDCALAELLVSWGVRPSGVVGRGRGELAAAYCAGVFGIETAMALAAGGGSAHRARAGQGSWSTAPPLDPAMFGPPSIELELAGATALDDPAGVEYWAGRCRRGFAGPAADGQALGIDGREVVAIGPDPRRTVAPARAASPISDGWERLMLLLAELYVAGVPIDWRAVDPDVPRRRIHVPTTPFERRSHWMEPQRPADTSGRVGNGPLSLAKICAGSEQRVRDAFGQPAVEEYERVLAALDEASTSFVVEALIELGWDPGRPDPFTTGELASQLGVGNVRLLGRLLSLVADGGVLQRTDSGGPAAGAEWRLASAPQRTDPAGALDRLESADAASEIALLRHCGPRLAGALTGRSRPFDQVIESSPTIVADIYRQSWTLRLMNTLAQEALAAIVAGWPAKRPLRILEVGAGFGATTAHLLTRVPGGRTEYVFTDIDNGFLDAARAQFAAYPFVRYDLLDIERTAPAAPFTPAAFDVVVAANALHTTRDVAAAVRNVRRLLAPGGHLLLVEGAAPAGWVDVTFGLSEGWWRFADDELRPEHPLLSAERWEAVLGANGFGATATVRTPPGSGLPQTLVVAEADRTDCADPAGRVAGEPEAARRSTAWRDVPGDDRRAALTAYLQVQLGELLEELGMPLDESVGTGVELSDLGMDSLMAIDLRSRLQRDLELELPLTVLGDHPTIEALAGCLHRMLGSTSVAAASPIAPVVALRTGAGAGSPVFCVGGAVGDGSQFRPLARALETRRAIYGLHPPGIDGSSPPTDLDRIARRHVEAIGAVAPHGPVVLVGHSFGALVAFEISQRLAAAGRPVESLVVLDAALAGRDRGDDLTEPGSTREFVAFASAFERSLEIDLGLPAAAAGADAVEASRIADLVDRLAAAGVPFTAAEIDRMLAVYRANMTAMSRYRPDVRYPLPIELVVADDADPHVTAGRSAVASDPDLGWGCASVVGVRVRTVPGTHFTMLREPHVAALARQLTDCLAAAPDVPAQR